MVAGNLCIVQDDLVVGAPSDGNGLAAQGIGASCIRTLLDDEIPDGLRHDCIPFKHDLLEGANRIAIGWEVGRKCDCIARTRRCMTRYQAQAVP